VGDFDAGSFNLTGRQMMEFFAPDKACAYQLVCTLSGDAGDAGDILALSQSKVRAENIFHVTGKISGISGSPMAKITLILPEAP
jgi:hypothetical protein